MPGKSVCLFLLLSVGLSCSQTGFALDFFFVPDSSVGDAGDTILVSGWIGPSDSMRGFTIYMAYDTNLICLAAPVTAGHLIADRDGLNFGYFDHDYLPDVLEVYGTIMNPSVDFWAGPGELFRLSLKLRSGGESSITAPYPSFFISGEGGFPPVAFHPATVTIRGSGAEDYGSNVPAEFGIRSVYPNPFNSFCTISFSLPNPGRVEIVIYDILGRRICTLSNSVLHAGEHLLRWDAKGMSSGAYLIAASHLQMHEIKTVIYLK